LRVSSHPPSLSHAQELHKLDMEGKLNRPLAKLSEEIEIADTDNQEEAKRKASSAVTVTLR